MTNGNRVRNAAASAGGVPPADLVLASASEEETERLGVELAPHLAAGDLIALTGPLGAGKTRFVKGLARGSGHASRVRSPTFTLLHESAGARPLAHADLYRLDPRDVDGLGLEEALERGPLVVEWAERLSATALADALLVTLELVSETERRLSIRANGPRARVLLASWRGGR